MHSYLILLGSNAANAKAMISNTLGWQTMRNYLAAVSPMIESPDSTGRTDKVYVNAVVEALCEVDIQRLNSELKDYETKHGREHDGSEVAIDLDIVVADGKIMRPEDFQSPHFQRAMQRLQPIAIP